MGAKKFRSRPIFSLIENLNLNDCSFIKRIYGPTMFKEKRKDYFVWRVGNEE